MKKIFLFILVTVCLLGLCAAAETPFLEFSFKVDADGALAKGDVVECSVTYRNIAPTGLSSAELFISFSDGLKFNSDAHATGLADGWALWEPSMEGEMLKIALVDDSAVTPGKEDITVTFSFTVVSDEFSSEYINLSEYYIYDFDINAVDNVFESIENASFVVNCPEVSVENLGASLRINNTPALRFGVSAGEIPDGAVLGVLVLEGETDEELTHAIQGAKEYAVKRMGDVYVTDALEINSFEKNYTFRPFVLFCLDGGVSHCVYFDSLTRSAKTVAEAELETETDGKKIELLKAFCTGT